MRWIGVDGCRGGWIAAAIYAEGWRDFRIVGRIGELDIDPRDRVLIDSPIGLPASGRRACDLAARAMLGSARSRVFLDARRPLLKHRSYAAANRWGKRDGAGVSRQLWNILPKIAELDRFVTPERQGAIREAHPELAFARLNGGAVLPGKKTREGRALRRDLIEAGGFDAIDAWFARLRGSGAAADDLLDACALALAAREPRRVEGAREIDARGLRMEIWY
jgi:predicted RNase H-like nuclease